MVKKIFKRLFIASLVVLLIGFLIPEDFMMPVEGAGKGSYNQKSFWYYPWGSSGTHKGVDIFAKKGTPVYSSTVGIAFRLPKMPKGGNCLFVLGPKWRAHYYAHLNSVDVPSVSFVGHNTKLGTVGNTGNARNTPPHLHYAICSFIPYVWRADDAPQGWKKIWYLDPVEKLNEYFTKK